VQKHFEEHIVNHFNFLSKKKLLIAISGGLDSVVLTHLCKNATLDITLAHCNFNLRNAESDEDETFVIKLAKTLNIEVFVQHFNTTTYAENNKLSIQMAARALRYHWFQDLTEQVGFDYILTAHHADDNLETFLINLTRGTGLDGLTGIPEINGKILRPLLPFSRKTIESYAKKNSLAWREDSSNASIKYLRNQLRHEVIPNLKETHPQLLQNFKTTLQHLNDASDIVNQSVNNLLKRAIVKANNFEITYAISEFNTLKNPKAYLVEIFKPYGFTAFDDILNLLTAQSGKQIFSQTHRIIKDRTHLILAAMPFKEDKPAISIHLKDKRKSIPNGILFFNVIDKENFNTVKKLTRNDIVVDVDTLSYPLTIRYWKEGDYFYPLAGNGKKKLSKYFKDEKLSLLEKENCLLLCSNDDVVWILNYRADERFKVTKKTKKILKISFKK